MNESKLTFSEAENEFENLIEKIQYQGEKFVIYSDGELAAAIVPVLIYEKWKQQKQALFQQIKELQNSSDLDPVDTKTLAAKAVLKKGK